MNLKCPKEGIHNLNNLLYVFAAITFLFPGRITVIDFRGSLQVLSIEINRFSPAFIAHLDTQIDRYDWTIQEQQEKIANLTAEKILLVTGEEKDPQSLFKYVPTHIELKVEALTITQQIPEKEQNDVAKGLENNSYTIVSSKNSSQFIQFNQKQNWTQPSVSEEVHRLVEEALTKTSKNTEQKIISTSSGQSILVAKGRLPRTSAKDQSNKNTKAKNHKGEDKAVAENNPASGRSNREAAGPVDYEPTVPSMYDMRGDIVFNGGLGADGSSYDLTVYQLQDGFKQSDATVFFKEGRYEIKIEKLEGYLIGEVRNRLGELIGVGELNLYDLPDQLRILPKVTGMHLQLTPAPKGVRVSVISARSFGQHQFLLPQAQLQLEDLDRILIADAEGEFVDEGIIKASSFLMRASHQDHWGTLALGVSGERQKLKLFPNSMIDAFLETSLDRYAAREAKDQAIVWGKVIVDGRPVAGAEVEIAGLTNEPIFFNSFLPDNKLSHTTKNGLFAFANIPPGLIAVRAKYQGIWLPAEIIIAEPNHVSYLSLHSSKPKAVEVKTYDGLTGEPLPTLFTVLGTEKDIETGQSGDVLVLLPGGNGIMHIESDAGEPYAMSRVTINRKAKVIDLPMVKANWLNDMAITKRVNLSPNLGVIVGFVQQTDFEVFMGAGAADKDPNLLYFDSKGHVIGREKGQYAKGVAGGGFVIYNVEPGLQTLTLLPIQGRKIHTQVVVVEPEAVSTMTIELY